MVLEIARKTISQVVPRTRIFVMAQQAFCESRKTYLTTSLTLVYGCQVTLEAACSFRMGCANFGYCSLSRMARKTFFTHKK